jgi:hypothetical protein
LKIDLGSVFSRNLFQWSLFAFLIAWKYEFHTEK